MFASRSCSIENGYSALQERCFSIPDQIIANSPLSCNPAKLSTQVTIR